MRPRRHKRQPITVSLFPFLAVLICTLGVLIVMLVMAVHSAEMDGKNATQVDVEKDESQIAGLELVLETRQIQVDAFQQVRPDIQKRLSDIRTQRARVTAETRELSNRLVQLQTQLSQLESRSGSEYESATDEQFEELAEQLAVAKSELISAREHAKRASEQLVYWIIPGGSNNSRRRPIYIECDENGLTLQPHGIVLNVDDFVQPILATNPLDQALATISEYWSRYDVAGQEGKPYPLLVVRPGGAQSYLLARHAMKTWDEEFGYELVEDEKEIDFGAPDDQLSGELKSVIEQAKKIQREIIAQRVLSRSVRLASGDGHVSTGTGSANSGLIASPAGGGFVAENGNQVMPQYQSAESPAQEPADDRQGNGETSSTGQSADSSNGHSSSPLQSIAAQRGVNWALPAYSAGATGYVRPIRIFCSANQLELRSSSGSNVRIPISGSSQSSVNELIEEIWNVIETWGVAGQNGYWKPHLRFSVLPGGESRYADLMALLEQSGLMVDQN